VQTQGINDIYNNLTFGTKVLMQPGTKEILEKSKAKKEIFKQIDKLKKNGVNDILIIDHNKNNNTVPYINAEIIEFIEDKCFMNARTYGDYLEKIQDNGQKVILNIVDLYSKSKEKMIQAGLVTKSMFDTILHEYQEI